MCKFKFVSMCECFYVGMCMNGWMYFCLHVYVYIVCIYLSIHAWNDTIIFVYTDVSLFMYNCMFPELMSESGERYKINIFEYKSVAAVFISYFFNIFLISKAFTIQKETEILKSDALFGIKSS